MLSPAALLPGDLGLSPLFPPCLPRSQLSREADLSLKPGVNP